LHFWDILTNPALKYTIIIPPSKNPSCEGFLLKVRSLTLKKNYILFFLDFLAAFFAAFLFFAMIVFFGTNK
jgi:hypothetical protein